MTKREEEGITAKKDTEFSEWYTQLVQRCGLADLRYNVKGFLVFQPWSVLAMEKMYKHLEKALQKKGHKPHWMPTLIPKSNFEKESSHIGGFTPELFWVTKAGDKELEEPLGLRPTSETAFYQMFNLWIRSYKDLPYKAYQRCQVFRCETKATRPFLRSREFHWIETHCVHDSEDSAFEQVKEDMQTNKEVLHDIFGVPFIFFERPEWDKFPGASRTFASDALNPDGKIIQQPSTHMIAPSFSKAFDITFQDKDSQEKPAHTTCYGPAVSRIFASVIITHGDDKGLKFPWEIAPVNIMIVPIETDNEKITQKAEELKSQLSGFGDIEIDYSDKRPGEKFNYWEMKGIPLRIDLGLKDIEKNQITIFRRDLDKKITIKEKDLEKEIKTISKEFTNNLIEKADQVFKGRIKKVSTLEELKEAINKGLVAKCDYCSVDKSGEHCAEIIEKETGGAEVRGTSLEETEKPKGNCIVCGKPSKNIVYIGKAY